VEVIQIHLHKVQEVLVAEAQEEVQVEVQEIVLLQQVIQEVEEEVLLNNLLKAVMEEMVLQE
jgi:hypothetical protein